jgi:CheY-like chemotaxis protein
VLPSLCCAASALLLPGRSFTDVASGEDALGMLDKTLFDVIVTDLALPDIRGEEVVERALKRQPALAVIFTTGYDGSAKSVWRDGPDGAVMLQKPYDGQTIAAALEALMKSSQSCSHND